MTNWRPRLTLTGALVSGALALSGCATEKYVDEHIATVNNRVQALEGRVDGVDRTAQEALQKANDAGSAASAALAANKASEKFVYTDLGTGTSVLFDTNKYKLTAAAQSTLDGFADKLKSDDKNVYIEIIGHGDVRGSINTNRLLGRLRALAVRRYLTDKGIPLFRMEVVSWGEEKVPDPKDRSPAALQQSRRVDLIVKG